MLVAGYRFSKGEKHSVGHERHSRGYSATTRNRHFRPGKHSAAANGMVMYRGDGEAAKRYRVSVPPIHSTVTGYTGVSTNLTIVGAKGSIFIVFAVKHAQHCAALHKTLMVELTTYSCIVREYHLSCRWMANSEIEY